MEIPDYLVYEEEILPHGRRKKKQEAKLTIKPMESLIALAPKLPKNDENIFDILKSVDETIRNEIKTHYPDYPEKKIAGAISRNRGDWYEWILGILAWNFHAENPESFIVAQLPNVSSFNCPSLYEENLYGKIRDLKNKFRERGVELISSNPDFVIIDPNEIIKPVEKTGRIEKITADNIKQISSLYKMFEGTCKFGGVIGYISAKTSYRPDRRLQIPHEASLMKAIYMHLQTRDWIIEPKGIKYYAMSFELGNSDEDAFKTIATHSITSVLIKPERAVDEAFKIKTANEAYEAFRKILLPS